MMRGGRKGKKKERRKGEREREREEKGGWECTHRQLLEALQVIDGID